MDDVLMEEDGESAVDAISDLTREELEQILSQQQALLDKMQEADEKPSGVVNFIEATIIGGGMVKMQSGAVSPLEMLVAAKLFFKELDIKQKLINTTSGHNSMV